MPSYRRVPRHPSPSKILSVYLQEDFGPNTRLAEKIATETEARAREFEGSNQRSLMALAKQVANNATMYSRQNRKCINLRCRLKAGLRKPPRNHSHEVAGRYLPTHLEVHVGQLGEYGGGRSLGKPAPWNKNNLQKTKNLSFF